MKIPLFALLLFTPFCHADNVFSQGGMTFELMTIGYNKALDNAKQYYEENHLTYNQAQVNKTLEFLSLELNSYLNRANYTTFLRDDKLTYFNLFLNKNLISSHELTFENPFTDKDGEDICLFNFAWENTQSNNPTGLLTGKCTRENKESNIVLRTGIGNDSIYVYDYPAHKLSYTSEIKQGIPDLLLNADKQIHYQQLLAQIYRDEGTQPFTVLNFEAFTDYKNEKYNDFSFEGRKVNLLASFYFTNKYRMTYTVQDFYGQQQEKTIGQTGANATIHNQLPLYTETSYQSDYQDRLSPFELPVRGRFLSGLANNPYALSRMAQFMNSTWRSVSAISGYTGIPYRDDYAVTEKSLQEYSHAQGKTFTQLDLIDLIPNGRIQLYRWSDKYNGYVSDVQFEEGEKIPLDVGNYPNIDREELIPPDMGQSLLPILDSFAFLREIKLKAHTASCPEIRVPFLTETVSDNRYCTFIEDEKPLIQLFFILGWTLSGLIIVFRSH
uniref:Uncharacterized protein n=1 Tax=Providencia stuartii TaxID=588 RepID=A0AAI9GEH1_PROST|nr:hypothetical protein [Providencia stuartii]